MAFPTAAAPHHEVTFQLGDHALVAVSEFSSEADQAGGIGLTYDLFADGRSLGGGPSLELARAHAPAPGTAYPASFRVIDAIYLVTPAAGVSGLALGITRTADKLGWQSTIVLLMGLLAALIAARVIGLRSWSRVRADASRSVARRAAVGAIVALASYGAVFGGWLAIALLMGIGRQ